MTELTSRIGADATCATVEELLQHGVWVRGFCRQLVGANEGDDLAQETWLAALRRPPRSAGHASPRPWLASVARRLAADGARSAGRRTRRERIAARAESTGDAAQLIERTELAHAVASEMLALREPFRTTLLLRYVEGMRPARIAARLDVPAATVRTRLARGLELVRERLDARHGGDRERWTCALAPWVYATRGKLASVMLGTALLLIALVGSGVVAGIALWPRGASAPAEPEGAANAVLVAGGALQVEKAQNAKQGDESPRVALEPVPASSVTSALVAPRVEWRHTEPNGGPPLLVGDRIVLGGGSIRVLDADSGEVLWRSEQEEHDWHWRGTPSSVAGGVLAVHSSGAVTRFSLEDGRVDWRVPGELTHSSGVPGVLVYGLESSPLYVLGGRDVVTALSAEHGHVVWSAQVEGGVNMTLAADAGLVFGGTESGLFFALDAATGAPRWEHETGSNFTISKPVVADGVVYAADRGISDRSRSQRSRVEPRAEHEHRPGALNAWRVADGELLWSTDFGATGFSLPHVHGDLIWAGFGTLCAPFRRSDGKLLQERAVRTGRNAFGTPRVIGKQLVFGNLDGRLYAHDLESGERLWAFAPEPVEGRSGVQVSGYAAGRGRLYVTSTAGLFALSDPPGAEPLPAGSLIGWQDGEEPTPLPQDSLEKRLRTEAAQELVQGWLPMTDGRPPTEVEPAVLAEILAAFDSAESTRVDAALMAVAYSAGIELDGGAFRARVLPHARSADLTRRVWALFAMAALGPHEGDLALAHETWEQTDPVTRRQFPRLLTALGKGRIEGRSSEIVLEMLAKPSPREFHLWASGLWGARVDDALSARLVELATDARTVAMRRDLIYFVLSTLQDKRPAVVRVLIETVSDPNLQVAGRALWGLSYGIASERQAEVAEALLEILESSNEIPNADRLARIVRRYGRPEQIARLAD